MGEWAFGCDLCQTVCPWNRKVPVTGEPALMPAAEPLPLPLLLGMTEEDFRGRFKGTALKRPKRQGLLRNAAVALGNRKDPAAVPALTRALSDPAPLVREHAAWALARIAGEEMVSHDGKD
jgi:epoxyqueuosine reductase